ncbi:MAG: ATP-binding protein [Synergistota bacterium]|nr:ATP-binding protein [Synergistota bacterium]
MYIERHMQQKAIDLSRGFPCIAVTGARQSGKTTFVRHTFPQKLYVSLENPDEREFAKDDPRGFLDRFPDGAILDEAQHAPWLFSYLQERLDFDGRMGLFILTGSQHFHLVEGITQSLAGRTALLHLPPFSFDELKSASLLPAELDTAALKGGYPPLHVRDVEASSWLVSYTATYLERDVRSLLNVRDLSAFQRFLRLCAGRAGQLLNLSSLSAECGVVHNTAKAWISVLEAGSIVFLLRPYFRNFNKRLVKTPKLYFLDTGLLCHLLGIRDESHLETHPLRGAIVENMVAVELLKVRLNEGLEPELYFWRDGSGFEIDFIIENDGLLDGVEVKSGKTVTSEQLRGLNRWSEIAGRDAGETYLVYGGDEEYQRDGHAVVSWRNAAGIAESR